MGYIGSKPSAVPLTSADITDNIIVNADIASGAAIAYSKLSLANSIAIADLSATGTPSSSTFLRGDNTWGSAGATAGQVIQVLSATDSTQRSTTSSSFVTASNTLSVTITPSSTANKILIIVTTSTRGSSGNDMWTTIYRGATDLGAASNKGFCYTNNGGVADEGQTAINYLDSPATTSATTYQVYFRSLSGQINYDNTKGVITCMEIKG